MSQESLFYNFYLVFIYRGNQLKSDGGRSGSNRESYGMLHTKVTRLLKLKKDV